MATKTIPKNKHAFVAAVLRTQAQDYRNAADRIRHWIGPEPTREEIAHMLDCWASDRDEMLALSEEHGADRREIVDSILSRMP